MDTALLYRPLADGAAYSKLVPFSACTPTYVGYDNTFLSLELIRDKANESIPQVKKITPKFRGATLSETVNHIYRFVHDHFQYKADGAKQQVLSFACAWKKRREGIDCKTYTVVASALLQSLGIHHYIRKVKQPMLNPEDYTHVYIIVPKDQLNPSAGPGEYLTIDGTTHTNVEVPYLQKHDVYMNAPKFHHYGLAAPSVEATPDWNEIILNFQKFLGLLRQRGVPAGTLEQMNTTVRNAVAQGRDPQFAVVENTVIIDGISFDASPRGLGIAPVAAIIGGGSTVEKLIKPVSKILKNIIPTKVVSNTIGAVFANGFKLSCWGSSASPSKAKDWAQKQLGPYFQSKVQAIQNMSSASQIATALSNLHRDMIAIKLHQEFHRDRTKKCSKEGNQMMADFAQEFADQTEAIAYSLKESYTVTTTSRSFEASSIKPEGISINWKGSRKTGTYKTFTLKEKSVPQPTPTPVPKPAPSATPVTPKPSVPQPTPVPQTPITPAPVPSTPASQPQKAGMGGIGLLLLAGIAGGAIYYKNKNKPAGKR